MKPELQLQLNLNSLSFLLTLPNEESTKDKKWLEGRKESQEVEAQAQTVLTLGLYQITKFIYRLDEPLGEGNV